MDKFYEIKTRHLLECKIDFRTHDKPDIDDLVYQLMDDRGELIDMLAEIAELPPCTSHGNVRKCVSFHDLKAILGDQ